MTSTRISSIRYPQNEMIAFITGPAGYLCIPYQRFPGHLWFRFNLKHTI